MNNKYKIFLVNSIFAILLTFGANSATAQVKIRPWLIPAPNRDMIKNMVAGSVSGKIVWNRLKGLPPMHPGADRAYPLPCGLFIISAMDRFEKVKTNEPITEGPAEEGDYYVCRYRIEGLPKNKSLTIRAELLDLRLWDTEPWISYLIEGGRPQPPAGYHRIFNVNNGVILTNEQPSATADFNISYASRPSPSDPR